MYIELEEKLELIRDEIEIKISDEIKSHERIIARIFVDGLSMRCAINIAK